jgi:hypothetical protein
MDDIVNFRMLSHPMNWLIVWIVLAIAAFFVSHAREAIAAGNKPTNAVPG